MSTNKILHYYDVYLAVLVSMPEATSARRISDAHHQVVAKDDDWSLPHNACAQSDLTAAMQAIQDTVQHEIAGSTDDVATMLFQDVQDVLLELLQRALVPVADDDFQDYINLYHVVPMNLEDEQTETETEDDEQLNDDEEEIDQDDLLDRKALQEAQHLRSVVRDLAKHVEDTREGVLKGSLQTIAASQGYADLMKNVQERPLHEPDVDASASAIQEQREALHSSLGALSSLLKDSQWSELPQQLDSLQSTIDVIQKESDKDRPLSQIEAAIISRSNSADEETTNDWQDLLLAQPTSVTLTAADRLARFFEQIE
jgi:hypothetical protein